MKIEIYTGVAETDGRVAWATQLVSTDDRGLKKFKASKDVLAEGHSKNEAELIAVTKGLQSVKPEFREFDLVLYVASTYVSMLLEKIPHKDGPQWKANPKINIQTATALRTMVDKYPKFSIEKCTPKVPQMIQCRDMAAQALVEKQETQETHA